MALNIPFLTSYDPQGVSEGTLDPLGLYQIAEQLAVQLVPAVRERMQRIRFLTAMAVGALVTEDLVEDPGRRDAAPYLVWEWLIVESIVRTRSDDPAIWGVPGTLVAKRASVRPGYLDAVSYLKTPRIFGFHGVYKRLAIHLGVVDVNLRPGPNTEVLADAWARDRGLGSLRDARDTLGLWTKAVRRGLEASPPRTHPQWGQEGWGDLADAFAPATGKYREKRVIRDLLLQSQGRSLGALPEIWDLQEEFTADSFSEELLHNRLQSQQPRYTTLLKAIRSYEALARRLQDAFDILRGEAGVRDTRGFEVAAIAKDPEFIANAKNLHRRVEEAKAALSEVVGPPISLLNVFDQRFRRFAEPMTPAELADAICSHHMEVQDNKGKKRYWFEKLGGGRIYIRHSYRIPRPEPSPERYVHDYRGRPIRRFKEDLR